MPTGINKRPSGVQPPASVRTIPSCPGYGATADGRIWSFKNSRYRASRNTKRGYLRVNLSIDGVVRDYRVHQLVGEAWHPNPDGLPMLNHKDTNKHNNRPDNLEWCTGSHNIQHSVEHGLHVHGVRAYNAKLTDEAVREIRKSPPYTRGLKEKFGVDYSTIHSARHGEKWKHVR